MAHGSEIWDPLRKKSVARTPEEEVRQWFISAVLHEGMGVPEHMMMSEVSLNFNNMDRRADIVVYSRSGKPAMIVECKRPEVELGQETVDQALRYNKVLDVKYITITNGRKTFMFRRGEEGYEYLEKAPTWEEIK
jgi:type I site-specific restriction endonuclease